MRITGKMDGLSQQFIYFHDVEDKIYTNNVA